MSASEQARRSIKEGMNRVIPSPNIWQRVAGTITLKQWRIQGAQPAPQSFRFCRCLRNVAASGVGGAPYEVYGH